MIKKNSKKQSHRFLSLAEPDLKKLAHEGTKEAIAKIEAYMKSEKDYDKKTYAQMALEECEFMYYQPKNEKEEEDFLLCELIKQKQNRIGDMLGRINKIQAGLDKFSLEQKVHTKVLSKNKNKKEDWKYNYMEDFVVSDRNKLAELKDNIAYKEAWIIEAKKMIASPRYKNGIPERHLSHFDFGFDDDEFADDVGCDCCDSSCPNCDGSDADRI